MYKPNHFIKLIVFLLNNEKWRNIYHEFTCSAYYPVKGSDWLGIVAEIKTFLLITLIKILQGMDNREPPVNK